MACNLYRKDKPYRGVNDFLLNLLVDISGWNTPYFVTMKQMDDENLKYSGLSLNNVEPKFDKDGMPMFDKDGNLRYRCEGKSSLRSNLLWTTAALCSLRSSVAPKQEKRRSIRTRSHAVFSCWVVHFYDNKFITFQ